MSCKSESASLTKPTIKFTQFATKLTIGTCSNAHFKKLCRAITKLGGAFNEIAARRACFRFDQPYIKILKQKTLGEATTEYTISF